METASVVQEVVALVHENQILRAENERLRQSTVNADRFYNVALSTTDVARLHSVSDYLVRKYIELGLIEKHPLSTDKKLFVRASVALTLDFTELKNKSKYWRNVL